MNQSNDKPVLERIEYLQRVWRIVLPPVPAPLSEDIAKWCNYADCVIEQAIFRTGKKFAVTKVDPANFDPLQAYRYVTGTARHMSGGSNV